MTFLEQWLTNLADELNYLGQQGAFSQTWLTDGRLNKQSRLHGRVFGAMIRAVERPLIPMVEIRWNQSFKPDLCVADKDNNIIAVIEYESSNSSDERLMDKDINHYKKAILSYVGFEAHPNNPNWKLPDWWIIVSTLPDCPVRRWPWWPGYHSDTRYAPYTKDKSNHNRNPLKYYEAGLHSYLEESWNHICDGFGKEPPCRLVWVNLTPESLDVQNINGQKLALPTQFPLRLQER